jgi:hypothetical protein
VFFRAGVCSDHRVQNVDAAKAASFCWVISLGHERQRLLSQSREDSRWTRIADRLDNHKKLTLDAYLEVLHDAGLLGLSEEQAERQKAVRAPTRHMHKKKGAEHTNTGKIKEAEGSYAQTIEEKRHVEDVLRRAKYAFSVRGLLFLLLWVAQGFCFESCKWTAGISKRLGRRQIQHC